MVPHYLMGIAAGAGIMGLYMIVCGFFQPLNSMPKVRVWAYGPAERLAGWCLATVGSVALLAALAMPSNPSPHPTPPLQPIFRYPLSYIAYHTWAFTGLMENEFEGTAGWGCPPTGDEVVDAACPPRDGAAVLNYYDIMGVDKVRGAGWLAGWLELLAEQQRACWLPGPPPILMWARTIHACRCRCSGSAWSSWLAWRWHIAPSSSSRSRSRRGSPSDEAVAARGEISNPGARVGPSPGAGACLCVPRCACLHPACLCAVLVLSSTKYLHLGSLSRVKQGGLEP